MRVMVKDPSPEAIRAAMQRRIEFVSKAVSAEIGIQAGGARGARENAKIAAIQASPTWKRNPWYLDAEAKKDVKVLIGMMLKAPERVESLLRTVGKAAVLKNVAKQVNEKGGAFRPLTDAYAKYKERTHGFRTPILKATGDLLGGLRVVINRL